MREILFKGKLSSDNGEKKKGEWVYGQYVVLMDGSRGIPHIYGQGEVFGKTVSQFTGLTDKNGTKIFEGDVLKADGYIFVVKFGRCGGVANTENYGYMGFYFEGFDKTTKKCMGYGLRNDICYYTEREVIGNIHDNPELMKGGVDK